MVQSYLPHGRTYCRHLANSIELVHPSAHSSPQPKRHSDRFSRFLQSLQQNVLILYNGRPYPPELAIPTGDLEPHLTRDSLGPSEPKRHLERFSRFCTDDRRVSLYFTMVCLFPLKIASCPLAMGVSGPHVIRAAVGMGIPVTATVTA